MLKFDDCEVLRQDRRVCVRGVDAALVEQRGPQEVPQDVLPFGPIQYSGAFGSCTGNAMAGQYSWNANAHSFHLQKWYGFLFSFHGFQAFRLRRFDDVGAGHLEIENCGAN